MTRQFLFCLLLTVQYGKAQQKLQLAPPIVQVPSSIYNDSTHLTIRFNQPGAAVHYTWDDREPVASDPVYQSPLPVNRDAVLKLRSMGADYLPSETLQFSFRKMGQPVAGVRTSTPHTYYANQPATILHDGIAGNNNYRSGTWLGFDSDTVTVEIDLKKEVKAHKLSLGILKDENSWIFFPKSIVFYFQEAGQTNWTQAEMRQYRSDSISARNFSWESFSLPSNKKPVKLKLLLENISPIPDWHPGKGNKGWIFIDEVIID